MAINDVRRPTTPKPLGRAGSALLPDELALGAARLRVRDLERSRAFYEDAIGLTGTLVDTDVDAGRGSDAPKVLRLADGAGVTVLELEEHPGAASPGRTAGVYHVALLYPNRKELARAIRRIAELQVQVEGASDHGTHEALYLPDPDGNGLELAADRPEAEWPNLSDIEEIRPRALNVADLLATTVDDPELPRRAGAGVRVGHVHLHVGDIERALAHYADVVGFEIVTAIDSAAFVSAGGYHHHLAVNTWRGDGIPAPRNDAVGLAWWTIELPDEAELDALAARLEHAGASFDRVASADAGNSAITPSELRIADPWGIELRARVAAPVS